MRRTILCLAIFALISSKLHSQYADLGDGTLKNQIWWFDWNGFTISNGASRTFTTGDGLVVTVSFSNVQGPVFYPNIMNTWYGSVLHFLYDFSDPTIKPALFSPYTTQNSQYTVSVTATRNGAPAPFKFIAADAEASALSEITTLTTNGSNWKCIDFFRNSGQTSNPFFGCNTTTAMITDTYAGSAGLGQNPVIATDAGGSGSLTVNCSFNRNGVEGQMAIAFGIFGSVDMGDLPPSYGVAQHTLAYTTTNSCNYLPPLPSTSLVQNLKIGATAGDADPVQTPDDNTNGADEDGISSFPLYNGSGSYSLAIPVTNTTGNTAYLTGWFDLNRNGTFDNNEYVTAFLPNNATTATLTWNGLPSTLPAGITSGWAFRFRLSSSLSATLNASGYAPDGEVEDYLTTSLVSTTADFILPNSVCVNQPITITNISTNASTYYWNFCSGSLNATPAGTNFPSPTFSLPVFMDLVQDGPNYYCFVVNHTGSLVRMDFGNSLLNAPTLTDLGSFGGIIPYQAEGIEIQKDGSNWIGYIIGGQNANSRILKLSFGSSVANVPTATNLGNIGGLDYPVDFTLQKDATGWYGFTVSADNNTVTRYSFGNSLNNIPVATNLGNVGSLNYPVGIFMIKSGNNYHLFITNRNSHTISRLDFGASLANAPSGTNLGNPGNRFDWPRDITVIRDCDKTFGFVTNEGTNKLTRLDFTNNDLLSVPVTTDLGNVGNMNFPSSISEIFRTGDAVNFLSANVNSNSITRVTFNNCAASSIPSYTGQTPPPFQYSQPGIYNVSLFVDDGLATQTVVCKQVVVNDCIPTIADFQVPDTVCVNTPVTITNTSSNATSSYWNFCVANINSTPGATNLGNIGGQFLLPVFIDYVQYNGNWYGFMTNNTPGKLTRLDFGNSLLNTPTAVNLGNIGGIINDAAEGIQVVFNEGRWYAIIVGGNTNTGGSRIMKIDFGPALTNTAPTGTNWGNIGGMNYPGDLHLFNDNGNWYGFTVDANSSVIRFSFGSSFVNPPTAVNFGNVGGALNGPDGIYVISDNGQWYAFVSSRNSSTITRLDFGTSLLNTPTATNLGNPGNTLNLPRDIYVMKFCSELVGLVVNEGSNDLVKLNFSNITSVPAAVSLGNVGNLSFPHSISKIFRVGPDLYSFIPNVNNNTLTRINFSGCSNSTIPNYAGANPPAVTYTSPGTYNINLTIDDGLPTQASVCKQIVVRDCGRVIGGVINSYTEVLGLDPCTNKLTVASSAAYNVGDTVLLIQMRGAVIDSTNTAAFGTITDYGNAGNYEFNYVKSKTGNVIELKNIVTRQYDIPVGKVQLVRVPYYRSAVVSVGLTCFPWNGTTGGVLAFNVQDTLSLNGVIDASAKGFRGGANGNNLTNTSNCGQAGYNYPSSSPLASPKGESIAYISSNIIRGRGAPASAGGGGDDHNSGGGGGGNGGMGGAGGYQFAGCPGAPFDNGGKPGRNLPYSNADNKVFLGGGGGSGHANNAEGFQPNGGDGGGIIFIQAGYLKSNAFAIYAKGAFARSCPGTMTNATCNEGMGGGGGGGTIVLNINSYIDSASVIADGGKGADINDDGSTAKHGPGGGGGGGVVWLNQAATPPNLWPSLNGGVNGLNLAYGMDPWGSTAGGAGQQVYNVQVPIDNIPFKANIDSVRIKDSLIACSSFDFKGFGYTNTNPVASWQWYFGDGNTANTQNTSHSYTAAGPFTVKLVVTDINGCRDSITKQVTPTRLNFDFDYQINACNPLSVQFNGAGTDSQNPYWSFGDASSISGTLAPVHVYPGENTYIVKYSVSNGVCTDTVTKTINLSIIPDDIVLTHDTTICLGTSKQLLTRPALSFCWNPTTYLNDPNSANPITSTPQNITYYYTAETTGNNLIINSDFSQGNTGFTSQYTYTPPPNTSAAQYFVGTNPQAWNIGMVPCTDHTTGSGNMLLVNGSDVGNVIVWSQSITVQPNTTYAFSTWIEHITTLNPAQLQFSINGVNIGAIFQASSIGCLWQQFHTTWNSGANTTAVISIVNKNLVWDGNDFALDDISFAPVYIKRDSVKITVDNPVVRTNADTTICPGKTVQLNATGAATYSWSPSTGLNNTGIPNPAASPLTTTEYIVTGTSISGCLAKDSITINVYPQMTITKTRDTAICKNSSFQLSALGGTSYSWSPAGTLDNPGIPNPVASPSDNTTYYVTVTDANTCSKIDSVKLSIRPDPVFTINPAITICEKESAQLNAGGGNVYVWQTDPSLSNPTIFNPVAAPVTSTNYSVQITETTCNTSATLTTTVNVNSLPGVHASKSNDIDCSNDRSQLNATGAKTYVWSPASTLNNANLANPVAMPLANTMYVVKGTDAAGCSNYDSVLVNFLSTNASGYFMPNAFTPNHDGLNDCYGIRYWGVIQDLEFGIYNRWGERIFFTKNPNECWDGTYKGKMQDIGVYVYMIKAKTLCGSTFKKGLFTLAR